VSCSVPTVETSFARYAEALPARDEQAVADLYATISIMGEGPVGLGADVTWDHGHGPAERFCYQLVAGEDGYRIAVLTLLER